MCLLSTVCVLEDACGWLAVKLGKRGVYCLCTMEKAKSNVDNNLRAICLKVQRYLKQNIKDSKMISKQVLKFQRFGSSCKNTILQKWD